ncbi:ATP-binding protein [Streptomyces sp. NPDC093224]|uniref:ATP-binding protein n=1 Tax=Streptomyces sp. NPDC093224 TaxID=3155198 RepID=UPI00343BBFBB
MNSHQITRGNMLEALASPTAISACVNLASRPESVKAARDFVAYQLACWGHPDLEYAATLVCSELVTNAVRHANPDASTGECMVALTLVPGEALITQVADPNPAPPIPKASFSDTLAEHGRGLSIVTQLTAHWSASPRPDGRGKVISAYLLIADRLPGQLAPEALARSHAPGPMACDASGRALHGRAP